jgi:hypothetical protein
MQAAHCIVTPVCRAKRMAELLEDKISRMQDVLDRLKGTDA